MREFKTLFVTTNKLKDETLESIVIKLPNDSKILKIEIENEKANLANIYFLNILVHTNIYVEKEIEYTLGIFKDGNAVNNSWLYINSFKDHSSNEYHVCLLKEQN